MSIRYLTALALFAQPSAPIKPTEADLDAFARLLEQLYHEPIKATLGNPDPGNVVLAYVSTLAAMSAGAANAKVRTACTYYRHVNPALPEEPLPVVIAAGFGPDVMEARAPRRPERATKKHTVKKHASKKRTVKKRSVAEAGKNRTKKTRIAKKGTATKGAGS